jgi:hypothetical protein
MVRVLHSSPNAAFDLQLLYQPKSIWIEHPKFLSIPLSSLFPNNVDTVNDPNITRYRGLFEVLRVNHDHLRSRSYLEEREDKLLLMHLPVKHREVKTEVGEGMEMLEHRNVDNVSKILG